MVTELVTSYKYKDNYLLIPTGYEKGDKFEIHPMFYKYGGPPTISRTREEGEGWNKRNILYYSPSLFWAIPRDLHSRKLTVVGMVSETEGFKDLPEYRDREYLIIKID